MKIIALGKVKERHLAEGIDEFTKRLTKFTRLDIVELKDEKILKDKTKVKQLEAERILKNIKDTDFVIALDETGKRKSSKEFSELIKTDQDSNIVFIVGGALGLHKEVISRADLTLSLSDMTFTHQMARFFLIEQIYRAFTILKNIEYHK